MTFPYADMSDAELVQYAYLKDNKTDLELELSTRLEAALEYIQELEDGDDT